MELKINFVDFWPDFDIYHNNIVDALSKKYMVLISDDPDFLFYSVFGYENLDYVDCVKIFYTGENVTPDFNLCDYAIGFDLLEFGDRYLRLPLYTFYGIDKLGEVKLIDKDKVLNRGFCSFVVSNANGAPERERFFRLLSEYKRVDSGGRYKNNIGRLVESKTEFICNYKFNIAFENNMCNGYTTEKIMEPMLVNTLPIYWGNKLVNLDFNPDSFVNVLDYSSLEDAVERIVALDNNDDEYLEVLSKPWFNKENYLDWQERFCSFMERIVCKQPFERKYLSLYGFGQVYRERLRYMLKCQQDKVFWKKLRNPLKWY